MGVLLRADLTRSQPSHPFRQKSTDWLNWPCPVRSALKRTPVQDFDSFSIKCSTTLLAPHIKKLETYFALFICLDFRTVCTITYVWVIQDESWQSVTCRAHNFDNLTWQSDLKKKYVHVFSILLIILTGFAIQIVLFVILERIIWMGCKMNMVLNICSGISYNF